PARASGSESPSIQHDLASYVREGLANNAGLRAAFERWRAALERVPQVTALPDPMLAYARFVEEVQTRTGPQRQRVGISQTFPWFGKLALRGQVAARRAEQLWHDALAIRLSVTRDIKNAWYEYGYLAQAIRITDHNLKLLQQLEPVVQRKIQAGAGQEGLLKLQVEIGELENRLETLRKLAPAISARLSALMNREFREPLPMPTLREPALLELESAKLARRILRENPKLEAIRQRMDRFERQSELARLSGLPDFTIGADYFDTGEALAPGTAGSGDDPIAVRIALNLPIWRSKYSSAEREARREREAASRELTELGNGLRADLEMRLYEVDDASRQIVLYRETLIPRARQSLEVTQTSYRAGTATILDVIDSERMLLAFENSYWRASSNYEQGLAEIEAICGGEIR
ncbi:MAG: TolC family protein, partial [Planctomycetota bacterium]